MENAMIWLNAILDNFLPDDIFARLDMLYNGSIIFLGAGVIVMLIAMVLMILSIRKGKKQSARA